LGIGLLRQEDEIGGRDRYGLPPHWKSGRNGDTIASLYIFNRVSNGDNASNSFVPERRRRLWPDPIPATDHQKFSGTDR
jgi:hypothetical protein